MSSATWVLEPNIFLETHEPIRCAIRDQGLAIIDWCDSWWTDGIPANVPTSQVVFHGSLGNAAQIAELLEWSPGSFCPTASFHCSSWYEASRGWLVHKDWRFTTANDLVANASTIAEQLSSPDRLFVRPDSPLKPFSGRVIETSQMSLAKLDHGFYYDDPNLPVVVAPIRQIGREWRFVVVAKAVVAGSSYDPATRSPISTSLDSTAAEFAQDVATSLPNPADVYILDVCDCDGTLHLIELNPFGGADLYACDASAVVKAVSDFASSN